MNYKFIAYPRFIPQSKYVHAFEKMVKKLERRPEIKSVYQIGSVSTPGISDIDVIVIFNSNMQCDFDPRAGLTDDENYIFSHKLFGISETEVGQVHRFTNFHNYKCISGVDILQEVISDVKNTTSLKTQLALEYLLRFYFNSYVESTYGIIKLRSLFLHVHALNYDLEFLHVTNSTLKQSIDTLVNYRKQWFEESIEKIIILKAREKLLNQLYDFLQDILSKKSFYMPGTTPIQLNNNMILCKGERLECSHRGITLPRFLPFINRRYFNLNHRLNSFEFYLPMKTAIENSFHGERFEYLHQLMKSQQANFPHFLALNPSLVVR